MKFQTSATFNVHAAKSEMHLQLFIAHFWLFVFLVVFQVQLLMDSAERLANFDPQCCQIVQLAACVTATKEYLRAVLDRNSKAFFGTIDPKAKSDVNEKREQVAKLKVEYTVRSNFTHIITHVAALRN